jgi:hypothetical protein
MLNKSWDNVELKATEEGASCAQGLDDNRATTGATMEDIVGNFKGVTADECR